MKVSTQTLLLLAVVVSSLLFSGCLAELLFDAGIAEEAGAAFVEEAVGEEGLGVASEEPLFTDPTILNEEESIIGRTITSEAELNNELAEIRMLEDGSGNPKLYIPSENGGQPFAEILNDGNQLRILKNGNIETLPGRIFSVTGDEVNFRSSPNVSPDNIVDQIKGNGRLVLKLGEENGWYKVLVGEHEAGYINSMYLAPAILIMSDTAKATIQNNATQVSNNSTRSPNEASSAGGTLPSTNWSNPPTTNWNEPPSTTWSNPPSTNWNASSNTNTTIQNNTTHANNTNSYRIITSTLRGPIVFCGNVDFKGLVQGQATIRQNANVIVDYNAVIQGPVTVSQYAIVKIYGVVEGAVYNYGGSVQNFGNVTGPILNR